MQYKKYFAGAFLLVLAACTKFEDAEVTERNTFVHFFSSATNYIGIVAEPDSDGGFIVSGEVRQDNGMSHALIIKTDARGHKIWEKIVPNGVINAVKPAASGYVLVGDSIQLNTGALDVEVSELMNTYARLILMDTQGNIVDEHITTGTVRRTINDQPVTLTIDYHGSAFDVAPNGDIVMLGSFRVPGEREGTFVSAFDPASISDSLWYQPYASLDHDLFNCNSLHVTSGSDVVWASRTFTQEQNVSREFVSVSQVALNSTFKTHTLFGESDAGNHAVEDLRKSPVGYCAVGTYTETNGLNANIYFLRLDINLNLIPGSERYIDGEDLVRNNNIMGSNAKATSSSFDEGLAVTPTTDGYVVAGTMTSTPTVGNGGKDILLIKLDPSGNLIWKKLIGGTGDETVASIRQTTDGGLLICGTNTVNGLSTILLMKTDGSGNLDN